MDLREVSVEDRLKNGSKMSLMSSFGQETMEVEKQNMTIIVTQEVTIGDVDVWLDRGCSNLIKEKIVDAVKGNEDLENGNENDQDFQSKMIEICSLIKQKLWTL